MMTIRVLGDVGGEAAFGEPESTPLPHRERQARRAPIDPSQPSTQYSSVVFTHSDRQNTAARARIAELNASGTYRNHCNTGLSQPHLLEG